MGFFFCSLQLIFGNGIEIFLEKEITRIQNKDPLLVLPKILYPCSSPGQTANSTLFPSGRTGIDLTIHVRAVDKGESLGKFLGMAWKHRVEQEGSKSHNTNQKTFFLHSFTFE